MADSDKTVRLTDLEVIQQFSLAVRGATAPRADVIAALEADLAFVRSTKPAGAQRPEPAASVAGSLAPVATPEPEAAKTGAARLPAADKRAPAKTAAKATKAPAKKAPAKASRSRGA